MGLILENTLNDIKFVEMPKKVQEAIRNFYQPIKPLNIDGDTLRIDNDRKKLICLDPIAKKGHL